MGGFADDWLGIDDSGGILGSINDTVFDDTFGLDPNGKGIWSTVNNILGDTITDDILGIDPNGKGITALWNAAAKIALTYGASTALDALNLMGTAGTTMSSAQTANAVNAYTAAGYSQAEAINFVAQATGNTAAAVEGALAGGSLVTQGSGLSGAISNVVNSAKQYVGMTGTAPELTSVADLGTVMDATNGGVSSTQGLWGSNMSLGDIGNTLGDMVKSGQLTESEAMQAMQAYNNAASSGSWADYLSTGAADDWASKSGLSLNDVFNTAKTANSVGNILKSLAGGAGNALSNLSTQDLSTLGSGGLAWYLANQYANKQENLANRMLTEADPYYDYRKNVETPARAAYAGLAPTLVNQAQATGQQAQGMLGDLFYQDKLKQSFTNPLDVYNTPEMQALNSQFLQGIERRDAAAGRNSQYGARALESQNNFLTNVLPTYRTGLNQGQQTATQQGSALGNLFSQQGNFANNIANLGMAPSAGAGTGATAFGNIMTEANKNSTYGMNPLIYGTNVAAGSTGSSGTNNLGSLFGLGNSIWNGIKDNISYNNVQDAMNSGIPSGADLADIANNSYNAAAAATNNWNTDGLDWFSGAF